MEYDNCFVSVEQRTVIDYLREDGRSIVGGETLEEVRKRYPDAQAMPYAEAARAIEEGLIAHPVERISEERYNEMLNVLPPCNWVRGGSVESFHISEAITGSVVNVFVRIGSDHFSLYSRARTTHGERLSHCRNLVDQEKALAADRVLESYVFGEGVEVVGQDGWDTSDRTDFTKVVYVSYTDDPEDSPSHKVSFHVRFDGELSSTVSDGYALEMDKGNELGRRGDVSSAPVMRG